MGLFKPTISLVIILFVLITIGSVQAKPKPDDNVDKFLENLQEDTPSRLEQVPTAMAFHMKKSEAIAQDSQLWDWPLVFIIFGCLFGVFLLVSMCHACYSKPTGTTGRVTISTICRPGQNFGHRPGFPHHHHIHNNPSLFNHHHHHHHVHNAHTFHCRRG